MFKKDLLRTVLLTFFFYSTFAAAHQYEPLVYMRPNETPLFTEIYQRYGLLNPPPLHVFDSSVYLGQPGEEGHRFLPSSEAFFKEVDQNLRLYHAQLKNQDLFIDPKQSQYVFTPATGSTQIIYALVHAIAQSNPKQAFLFVEKIPYFFFHEHALSVQPYPNARFQGFHDPKEIKPQAGETLVEFVTSPNNPDGKFRAPSTNANIIIADFVFSSPSFGQDGSGYIKENIAWLAKARSEGKHIFAFNTASKALGKPGYRLGYMWFPIYDDFAKGIFQNFSTNIWKLTAGGSVAGIADGLNLMSAIGALPNAGQALRNDIFHSIVKRHNLVQKELLARFPGSIVTSIPGSPTLFAQLKGVDLKNSSGKELIYKTIHASVDNGNILGATADYIRINLCGYSGDMAEFLNRLAGSKKYKAQDLLVSSAHHCAETTIHSKEKTKYVLIPNDCTILVDAEDADVTIMLPAFINYQQSNLITIKKLDQSAHVITIKGPDFTKIIKDKHTLAHLIWKQPFFLNGQWQYSS